MGRARLVFYRIGTVPSDATICDIRMHRSRHKSMGGYTYRELAEALPPDDTTPRPRSYRALAQRALPHLLHKRYGPQAMTAALLIQRAWRRWSALRLRHLRGPLVFLRDHAANHTDPWTLQAVADIPLSRFWSYRCPFSGCVYALDVLAAHRWFCLERREDNPFDRRPLPPDLREGLQRCYDATVRVPRVRAQLRREEPARMSATAEVFTLLERWYGLVFPIEVLRSGYHSMALASLFAFYQEMRWWILQYGPKPPTARAWLHDRAAPRHHNVASARQFVMFGFLRVFREICETEQGSLLLMLGNLLHKFVVPTP